MPNCDNRPRPDVNMARALFLGLCKFTRVTPLGHDRPDLTNHGIGRSEN